MRSLDLLSDLIGSLQASDQHNAKSEWKLAPSILQVAGQPHRVQLCIGGTFAVDLLEEPLKSLSSKLLGLEVECNWLPYHDLLPALLDPVSAMNNPERGIAIVLVRLSDLAFTHPEEQREVLTKRKHQAEKEVVVATEHQLLDAAQRVLDGVRLSASCTPNCPLLLIILPLSPHHDPIQGAGAEAVLLNGFMDVPNVHVLSSDVCARAMSRTAHVPLSESILPPTESIAEIYDERMDRLAHSPFTSIAMHMLAFFLLRQVARVGSVDRKLVVLDCDNTLWQGAIAEMGVEGIGLDPEYLWLQRFFVGLQERGVLLALCSRNEQQDVLDVFSQRKDMVLSLERHISGYHINWNRKSTNIADMVQSLQIGMDSVIFVDDNPLEVAEVMANCSGVCGVVVPGPSQRESIPAFLSSCWLFDSPLRSAAPTLEDSKRTELYKGTLERGKFRTGFNSFSAFMASLNLWMDFELNSLPTLARVSQLLDRTNQHNNCKEPRSESQLASDIRNNKIQLHTVTTGDRFCTHGLVGVFIVEGVHQVTFPGRISLQSSSDHPEYSFGSSTPYVAATPHSLSQPAIVLPSQSTSTVPSFHGSPLPECTTNKQYSTSEEEGWCPTPGKTYTCLYVPLFLLSCRTLHLGIEHAMVRRIGTVASSLGCDLICFRWSPAPRNEPARAFLFSLPSAVYTPALPVTQSPSQSLEAGCTQILSGRNSTLTSTSSKPLDVQQNYPSNPAILKQAPPIPASLSIDSDGKSKSQLKREAKALRISEYKALGVPRRGKGKQQQSSQPNASASASSEAAKPVGISQYFTAGKGQVKPPPGAVFIRTVDAAKVLIGLDDYHMGPPSTVSTVMKESEDMVREERLGRVGQDGKYSFHPDTYQMIAHATTQQVASLMVDSANLHPLQSAFRTHFSEEGGEDEDDELQEYRSQQKARANFRFEYRKALQKHNPESYYSKIHLVNPVQE